MKVGNEGIITVTDILQTNKKVEKLELVSVGSHEAWITNEIWMTFALNNYLTNVSLSSNPIEDKGCNALCTHWLATVSHPISFFYKKKKNNGKTNSFIFIPRNFLLPP